MRYCPSDKACFERDDSSFCKFWPMLPGHLLISSGSINRFLMVFSRSHIAVLKISPRISQIQWEDQYLLNLRYIESYQKYISILFLLDNSLLIASFFSYQAPRRNFSVKLPNPRRKEANSVQAKAPRTGNDNFVERLSSKLL